MAETENESMDMKDKIALVTAAASGAGRSGALILAREGASVAVVDQNEAGAKAVVDEIRKAEAALWRLPATCGRMTFPERSSR